MNKQKIKEAITNLENGIFNINHANGWDQLTPDSWESEPFKVAANIALIQSEASEALEGARAGDKENFEEELADVIIRVLDVTHCLGLDVGEAIMQKLEKNAGRGVRHGNKRF